MKKQFLLVAYSSPPYMLVRPYHPKQAIWNGMYGSQGMYYPKDAVIAIIDEKKANEVDDELHKILRQYRSAVKVASQQMAFRTKELMADKGIKR